MAVHQMRAFVLERDGALVDNERIGETLETNFWRPGNTEPFLDLVLKCTGEPLSGDAWVKELQVPVDDLVRHERADYDRALLDANEPDADVDLDMRVRLVDGDAVLADTSVAGSFLDACARFEAHVAAKYPQPQPSA